MINLKNAADVILEQNISILPYKDDWRTDNIEELRKEVDRINAKIIVEVGCWTGHTTAELAKMVTDHEKVIAVDHWLGQDWNNIKGTPDYDPLVATLYEQFLSNMVHENVQYRVYPYSAYSVKAAETLTFNADLIFIDACHKEESVYQDCSAWYRKLNKNGVLCGDDWFIDSVQNAVKRFAYENNKQIVLGPKKDQHPMMASDYNPSISFWKLT